MITRNNPIVATIDFEKEGIQHGFLRLPHSRDDSAWGAIMIPVTQMKNGEGPTALITGGNHGDEYEGPVALFNFAGRTDISDIQGRVIVVPAMNYPAFCSATRVSPIDSLNMNRIFPGKPHGSVTQIIADYFTRELLPKADYVLDIHSGGKTLDFVPFATCHELEDKEQQAKCEAAMKSLNAPYFIKLMEIDAGGMYDTQAENMGKVFVSTELGGGGTTTPQSVDIAKRSVDNFLVHAGILQAELQLCETEPVGLAMGEGQSYVFSQHTGLVEPRVTLGETVKEGDLIARIHITERTAMPPVDYRSPRDGLIIARHVPSLIKMGDCLNVVAEVMQPE